MSGAALRLGASRARCSAGDHPHTRPPPSNACSLFKSAKPTRRLQGARIPGGASAALRSPSRLPGAAAQCHGSSCGGGGGSDAAGSRGGVTSHAPCSSSGSGGGSSDGALGSSGGGGVAERARAPAPAPSGRGWGRPLGGSGVGRCRKRPLRQAVVAAATFATPAGGDEEFIRAPSAQFLEGLTGWRRRWTVVLLCFVAFMLCNMDRVNMSVAILPMQQQYGWDSRTVGLVQSSFFWGYLLTQVLGGIWADRFGGKRVLGLGVVWWSLATACTPLAAQSGLVPLLAARALMGVGEGVAMPAMNNMLARWVPVRERSRSLALVYSGMFLGSMMGLGLSPQIIQALGWPSVFYMFGSLGVVWYCVWQRRAASTPSEDPHLSPAERDYITANTGAGPGGPGTAAIPWRLLLSRKEVWAIIVCHFCHNWGTFILLTWMPTFYNQVLGCDILASGVFSVLPWLTMAVTANVGGWIADTLVSRGWPVTRVRKLMQTLGFLGPAFFLSQLGQVNSVPAAVVCMMGAQGFDAFSQSGLYSNHQDIGPRYAGVLLGMSNTAGVLAGVLGSLATGHLLAVGTWSDVWSVAVALYLVGTVVWNLCATGERIFD